MATEEQELEEDDLTPLTGKEVDWVKSIKAAIQTAFPENITVKSGVRLPYTLHVFSYRQESPQITKNLYQTDLLIAEELDGSMVPRVVVEFKLGGFTTHDALTYSAKAATHKNVHPYLRYGVVIARGQARQAISSKMMRHGQHFDFMLIIEPGKLASSLFGMGRNVVVLAWSWGTPYLVTFLGSAESGPAAGRTNVPRTGSALR